MKHMKITPGKITLSQLRNVYFDPHIQVELDSSCFDNIQASVNCVKNLIDKNLTIYGINTGFGVLASTKINKEKLETLQRSLVLSHAAGIGKNIDIAVVRLILLLKINSLAQGFSGIRLEIIKYLVKIFNSKIYPKIPIKGSVGASGDLAPLAHMSLILLGEGNALFEGKCLPAKVLLKNIGLKPITLHAKEGLALLNGTQISTAFALRGLFEIENTFRDAVIIGALTTEAVIGSRDPFDARIHMLRRQTGQITVAKLYRYLLEKSSSVYRHYSKYRKVQDPYSIRCQPQVMGSCLTQINDSSKILEKEINAVTDNPLVFSKEKEILSGGNFHAEPIAMAADNLALSISEIGALSERRIALMMDHSISQLPPFLVENSGLNSGFMISQVTAAALASENKSLSHPRSVDSLPTSANQEDHVSMAPGASYRLWEMSDNSQKILAIEWLAACQGLDMRKGRKTTNLLEKARSILREHVEYYDTDRQMSLDIEKAIHLLKKQCLSNVLPNTMCAR